MKERGRGEEGGSAGTGVPWYSPWATLHTKRRTPHFQRKPKTREATHLVGTRRYSFVSFGRFFGSQVGVTIEFFLHFFRCATGRILSLSLEDLHAGTRYTLIIRVVREAHEKLI